MFINPTKGSVSLLAQFQEVAGTTPLLKAEHLSSVKYQMLKRISRCENSTVFGERCNYRISCTIFSLLTGCGYTSRHHRNPRTIFDVHPSKKREKK